MKPARDRSLFSRVRMRRLFSLFPLLLVFALVVAQHRCHGAVLLLDDHRRDASPLVDGATGTSDAGGGGMATQDTTTLEERAARVAMAVTAFRLVSLASAEGRNFTDYDDVLATVEWYSCPRRRVWAIPPRG